MRTVLVAIGAVSVLAGCGGGDGAAPPVGTRAATAACAGVLPTPDAAVRLPADVPVVDGARLYQVQRQGKTAYYSAFVAGTDVVAARDAGQAKLAAAGYRVVSTDEEGNAEADLQFDGPHEGSLQVTPLCAGQLKLRYRLDD